VTEALYRDRADLYDRIYHWKDYASEAMRLVEILGARGVRDGARVLEVACGTGGHLVPLSARYSIAGIDLQAGMLAVARRKLPDVDLRVADMADFGVESPFDAVLCLFSSIGYLLTEERLRGAARCFARALRPGGCLIVEPWIAPEDWKPGHVSLDTASDEEGVLARAARAERQGDHSVVEFQWALAGRAGGVQGFHERHRMWLCPRETMRRVLEEAGFEVDWDPQGLPGPRSRGLFLGCRG
jgi:SAM-dependent methyltransferase